MSEALNTSAPAQDNKSQVNPIHSFIRVNCWILIMRRSDKKLIKNVLLLDFIMSNSIVSTLIGLSPLTTQVLEKQVAEVFLLIGKAGAGKNTLVHYLEGAQLNLDTDEEGYEILTPQEPLHNNTLLKGRLRTILGPHSKRLYISVTEPSASELPGQEQQWAVTLLGVLTVCKLSKVHTKLVLVYSLQQFEEDKEILVRCLKYIQPVPDFLERTHVVITRIAYEEDWHSFTEISLVDLVKQHPQALYLQHLGLSGRLHSFYAKQVQQSERQEMLGRLNESATQAYLQINNQDAVKQLLPSDFVEVLDSQLREEFRMCMQVIISSFGLLLLEEAKASKQLDVFICRNEFIQSVLGFQIEFRDRQPSQMGYIVSTYEQLRKQALQTVVDFDELYEKLGLIAQYWPSYHKNEFGEIKILSMLMSMYAGQQNLRDEARQALCHPQYGVLDEQLLSHLMHPFQKLFSPQFREQHKEMLDSPIKPGKGAKRANRVVIPSYEEQKNSFLSAIPRKRPDQMISLPCSPLKVELLLSEVSAVKGSKKRDLALEKRLLGELAETLEFYQCLPEAIQVCMVLPHALKLPRLVEKYLESASVSPKSLQPFFDLLVVLNRGQQFNRLLSIAQAKKHAQLVSALEKVRAAGKDLTPQLRREKLAKLHMNYVGFEGVASDTRRIVGLCIEFELRNPELIQRQMIRYLAAKTSQQIP